MASENSFLKEELREIKHKLDILISQKENDRLIIETLKDSLQSMNRLVERKEAECQRLSQQHESLLLEKVNESQESSKAMKENRAISMNTKKQLNSQQSSQQSIQNIQKDEKVLFDELRNFCFKKR